MAARRMAIIGLLFCLCLYLMPCGALAVTGDCTLTLSYVCEGTAIAALPVNVYQIADTSDDSVFTLLPQFQESGVNLNGVESNSEWDSILLTLEAYIVGRNLSPDYTSLTDSDGMVCLENLKPGLYLVASAEAEQEALHCVFRSALVALPGRDGAGHWQNALTVTPKPQILPPVEPEELQFKVLKLWKDDGNQKRRPQNITVEIFRNGISQETVILSEDNLWSYSWSAAMDGADWQVVERNIPDGYTVSVEKQNTTIILTNTWNEEQPNITPTTGDNANIFLFVALMLVSAMGLVLMLAAWKRKRL